MQNNLNVDPIAIPFGFNNYYLPLQDSIDRFVAFCTKCVHVSNSGFLSVTHTAFCKNYFCTENLKGIEMLLRELSLHATSCSKYFSLQKVVLRVWIVVPHWAIKRYSYCIKSLMTHCNDVLKWKSKCSQHVHNRIHVMLIGVYYSLT